MNFVAVACALALAASLATVAPTAPSVAHRPGGGTKARVATQSGGFAGLRPPHYGGFSRDDGQVRARRRVWLTAALGFGQTCSSSILPRWCATTSFIPSIKSAPKVVCFAAAFLGIANQCIPQSGISVVMDEGWRAYFGCGVML
jgi:hypothetical protein